MNQANTIQERVRFGQDGRLAGVLHYPASAAPRRAVLLCSPHPNFAGDMDNNVIRLLAEQMSSDAVVLRFDYRGIGESRINLPPGVSVFDYWADTEQACNYAEALADTADAADELWRICGQRPLLVVGYSFGALTGTRTTLADARFAAMVGISPPLKRIAFEFLADCPKPCLMLSGEGDFSYDADVAARLAAAAGDRLILEVLADRDHFFRGHEESLGNRVMDFLDHVDGQKRP